MIVVTEGSAKLKVPESDKISKEMQVFYNPVMGLNRDISILLLKSVSKNKLQIADPLAATGVRSIRFLKELGKIKIKNISINDYDSRSVKLIKENLELNGISFKNNKNIMVYNQDANLFLLGSRGFDYIDIDPFGAPVKFLDTACKRIARGGVLAVTATDTSALCGTYPKSCVRKYWAVPKKGPIMHETGLRILVRKIQLVAAQYDKALVPIFSYSREHYMRVFLRNEKGKNKADIILKQHGNFNNSGPMWLGKLWDENIASKIYKSALGMNIFKHNKELIKFLRIIKDESKINSVGFYDLNYLCKDNKIKSIQKKGTVIDRIRAAGFKASETHFKGEGIRSEIGSDKLIHILSEN